MRSLIDWLIMLTAVGCLGAICVADQLVSDDIPTPAECGDTLSVLDHSILTQLGCGRCTLCGSTQVEPLNGEPERCQRCGRLSVYGPDSWAAAVDSSAVK